MIRYAAEEGLRITVHKQEGLVVEAASKNKLAVVRREPVGIVLAIAPFNYPVNLSASKIAPALIAGNVVMFKPPSQGSPFLDLCWLKHEEAGIPRQVFSTTLQVVAVKLGYISLSTKKLTSSTLHSTPIGERIGRLALVCVLSLGNLGKYAALLLEDADLEHAAKQIVAREPLATQDNCARPLSVSFLEKV